jgi:hypothetical protein
VLATPDGAQRMLMVGIPQRAVATALGERLPVDAPPSMNAAPQTLEKK